MVKIGQVLMLAVGVIAAPAASAAPLKIGLPAPDFAGKDSNGTIIHLTDFKGKTVVLEWSNDGCPYVGKWYRSGAMQKLQREAAHLGAVWITVISSAPGEQGYVDGAQANADTKSRNADPAHVVLDPSGAIGHLYDAQTTPDIFVIRPNGQLAYMGGADSIASTRVEDIPKAEPYAREALEAVMSGKPVARPITRPYGCTVKYAD